MKYTKVFNHDTFRIWARKARWACCDCGLVHDLAFKVSGGKLFVTVIRNNRATASKRRGKKKCRC